MSDIGTVAAPRAAHVVDWPAIVAGGAIATGVSTTLLAFGSGIGLAVASSAPTWRDSSPWLWIMSGLFLLLVALAAFGFGGYATGRMRTPLSLRVTAETEFRDGMHGLITWGLAIFITALLALAGAAIGAQAAAPSGGPAASTAGEATLAEELDELYRQPDRALATGMQYRRAEAARILLKSQGTAGVPVEDRDYLSALVANTAHVAPADAAARVDRAIAQSKDALHRVRVAAVLQAFMIAAGLLLGAAVAWFSSVEGGRDRERGSTPVWRWALKLHDRRPEYETRRAEYAPDPGDYQTRRTIE